MFNKRGVDAVVATVLIIMITVSAVAIIWATVIPMIKDSLSDSTSQQVSLTIETTSGYTVYDSVTNYSFVQIKRGVDDSNLTGVKFTFFNGKESKSVTASDVPPSNTLPTNSGKVYAFYLGDFGQPLKVSISPIFTVGKKSKEGKILSEVSNIGTQGVNINLATISSGQKVYDVKTNTGGLETLRTGLVGYWPFDSDANDYSVSKNNGQIQGTTLINQVGKVGNSFSFNGKNSTIESNSANWNYVLISSPISLPLGNNNRTVAAWIKPTSFPVGYYNGILAYGGACNGKGFMLSSQATGRLSVAGWCNDAYQDIGTNAPLNSWTYTTVTYSGGTTIRFYMNGQFVQESSLALNSALVTESASLRIGAQNPGTGVFNGTIDEVAIWNRVLNDSEISLLYNGGNGRSLK